MHGVVRLHPLIEDERAVAPPCQIRERAREIEAAHLVDFPTPPVLDEDGIAQVIFVIVYGKL